MDVYSQIALKIIESQETIIGPVAVEQADDVPNITVDWSNKTISIAGNEMEAINNLVGKYQKLFGQISVEVSKQATAALTMELPPEQLPEALK